MRGSRSSGRERAHFYEYALGSTREARGWYYKCSIALASEIIASRLARLSRVVRILTAVIPRKREQNSMWRPRRDKGNQANQLDNPAGTNSS